MLCLRIDLDYVPWDSYNANLYGHGEPAMILRLLAFARETGLKFHFFVSNRSLRTFPTTADAILGEGHHLDLFCRYPEDAGLISEARQLFALAGHDFKGIATDLPWPTEAVLSDITFASGPAGVTSGAMPYFPITGYADIEILPLGMSAGLLGVTHIADESPASVAVVVLRPQILAKHNPRLEQFNVLVDTINRLNIPVVTLRDVVQAMHDTRGPS